MYFNISLSDVIGYIVFSYLYASPMPQFLKFPAIPASIPAKASSTMIQSSGFNDNLEAAVKNTSGCGFECVISFPSAIASKKLIKPILSRISFVFLLDEAIAIFKPKFLITPPKPFSLIPFIILTPPINGFMDLLISRNTES